MKDKPPIFGFFLDHFLVTFSLFPLFFFPLYVVEQLPDADRVEVCQVVQQLYFDFSMPYLLPVVHVCVCVCVCVHVCVCVCVNDIVKCPYISI